MPLHRRRVLAHLAGAATLGPFVPAGSAGFAQRPVRLVVPYSVGIGPDVVARALGERLSQQWGQAVVIDNKPGASGILAFSEIRRTPADGHVLFLADTATLAVNPLIHASLPYDPVRDITPLSLLFRATFLIWVGGGSRHLSLTGLMQTARQSAGSITYATLGNGHASHIAIETFARAAGLRMTAVPFKDAGAMVTAVAASQVDFTAIGANSVAGLMASGRLRPLAVAARQRLAGLPLVPTLVEAGGPAVEMHPWAALVAVAGTPAPILAQLQEDIVTALGSPDVRGRAEQAGFEITPSTPQVLRERIEADIALYRPLVDEGRIARM
jgi:tripartite-type tricarboxylate transporter receptor subunit TctC